MSDRMESSEFGNVTRSRRELFTLILFGIGITLSYGLFGFFSWGFLRPKRVARKTQMFVGFADDIGVGSSTTFISPKGERFLLLRDQGDIFTAYSSRCPHLGCKVHWQESSRQYFCPCHAGIFDSNGVGISGPPKGLHLKPCEIVTRGRALYAMVEP